MTEGHGELSDQVEPETSRADPDSSVKAAPTDGEIRRRYVIAADEKGQGHRVIQVPETVDDKSEKE